ncbi:FIVAR domain-containing protein, partial [Paenibacillus sepulcri]|nr:FIVAR domain-containing protein [Paenibacillus sepulcri]
LNLQEMAIVGSTNGYTDGKGFGGAGTAKQYPWGLSVPKDGITFEGTTTPGYDDLFKVPVDANSLVALMAPRPVIVMGGTEHGWTIAESQAQSVFAARKVYEFLGADPRRAQVTLTVQGHTITSYNRNALLMMGQKYFRGIDNPILDQDIRWTEASSLGITSATNTAYADANAYTTPYTPSYDAIPWGIPGHYNIDLDASRFLQGYGASFTASTTADTISIYEPFGALIRTVAVADGKAKITLSPGETKEYGSYKLVAKGAGLKDGVQYIEVATNKITFFGSNNMFKYAKVIFDPLITTVKNNNDVAADNGSSVRFIFGARIDPTNVKVKVNGNEKFNGEVIDRSGYTQEGQEPYWYFPAPGYYSNNAVAVNDVSLANYQTAEFTGVRFLDFFPDLTFSFNFFKKAGEPTSSYDQLPSWTVDNYQAIGVSGDRILLSWPKANNAQSYSVFVDGKLVGSTEDNVYQLNELASGTSYNVKVAAVNQTGSAAENLAADIRTLEGPVPEGVVLNGTDAVKAGQSFDLTYGLNGVEAEILAQDITIEYDADLIGLVSPPVSTDDKKFVVVDYEDEPGKLRILGIHLGELQADPNGGQITLSFKAKSDATAGIANIKVANVIAANKEGVESTLEGTTHNVQIDVINKTALNELIDEAQGAHDHAVEGKLPGQYPAGSKALLQAAIDLAQGVAANEDASQTEVEQAASALNEALQTFKASVIEKIPGDSNNDNKISIGDLAIMAAAYGKTSADADWDSVKNYDRNADGAIDILDLVTLAREILNW